MTGTPETPGYVLRRLAPGLANSAVPAARPSVVDEARAEAERLLEQARGKAEAIISRAEGAAKRMLDDLEHKARQQQEQTLASELLALHQQFHADLDHTQAELVRLVRDAVEIIIGSYPDEAVTTGIVRKALQEIGHGHSLVMRVPPGDVDGLQPVIDMLVDRGDVTAARLQPDPDLDPGTCRLEAGGLRLDVGLPAQLEALEARLRAEMTGTDLGSP
jgi:flagellar biosynthesis/type III secretory pathway protein FliH